MKLYVGSRDYKPEGYLTIDIDARMKPDFVADLCDLSQIDGESCDEVIASAVLEHIDWPDGFLALSELTRVLKVGGKLKVSVPDLGMMARMILSGESIYHIVGMMYGLGGRKNNFEQHRYGYTSGMLVDILETLGFAEFDWWNSDMPDAANGWAHRNGGNIAIPLNISAIKVSPPLAPSRELYDALCRAPDADFLGIAAGVMDGKVAPKLPQEANASKLYQLLQLRLIQARQRIKYLEELGKK